MPAGSKEQRVLLVSLAAMVIIAGYLLFRSQLPQTSPTWEWETAPAQSHSHSDSDPTPEEEDLIFVHVAGQVQAPGVYHLPGDARVIHAVEAAGGFTGDAAMDAVNLAMGLGDGQRVYIPASCEIEAPPTGMININQASAEELQLLPGIGPALAREIIDYRIGNGPFTTIDELVGVSGIGEKTVEGLRESVRVN